MSQRNATHAGSWYTDNGKRLNSQLNNWLSNVTLDPQIHKSCKAIIAPHAGYSYSGPAAAWAYHCIDPNNIKRVFILGPSHHVYRSDCALSQCQVYETPIGDLPIDTDTIKELSQTSKFGKMSISVDEDEHSIEMHLPYVRKMFENHDIKIVPILVGAINKSDEEMYGSLLAPYLMDKETFFVISSDFCHWGKRFSYTYYNSPNDGPVHLSRSPSSLDPNHPIHKSIEDLDHRGMDCIATHSSPGKSHDEFSTYLQDTRNTICGRHPIGVLLGAMNSVSKVDASINWKVNWVRYEQSSPAVKLSDSSVSYASACITIQ